MKRRDVIKWALRSTAMSVVLNLVVPMAEAWAAEEVQVLRKAPASSAGVMAFTTFQQEELAVTQNLPCKWISKDGRLGPSYGNVRYDFLCKGGDFATVSLYLDKAGTAGEGVAKVRLLYRDWPVNANPNAGEAKIAQQFLQHVAGRFVPAAVAGLVMDAFWAEKDRSWTQNGVKVAFSIEKGDKFKVRRLEVQGTGAALNSQLVQMMPVDMGLTKIGTPPQQGTQVFVYGKDGEKLVPEKKLPGVAVTKGMGPVTPTDAGLTKVMPVPVTTATEVDVLPQPAVVLPAPAGVLPMPGVGGGHGGMLVVPGNAPAGTKTDGQLQPATPAELNTAPAPESKVTPVAPPELSASLVPQTRDIKGTAASTQAPSNFDIYNKATELTKDIEAKAQTARVEEAKVTASKPVTPSTLAPETLKPVPVAPLKEAVEAPATPASAPGEGLGTSAQQEPAVEDMGQPVNYNGPRRTELRPLPQLKFVPKAEPLRRGDEVLQFEDEKSKL